MSKEATWATPTPITSALAYLYWLP
jgi:hypothetical protein